MPTDEPKPPTSDDPETQPTEPEQSALKRAEDSGDDATGGTGLMTGIAQA